jgi:hypothetical protein
VAATNADNGDAQLGASEPRKAGELVELPDDTVTLAGSVSIGRW